MSNWKIEAGKAIWKTGKNLLTSKKGGVEAIIAIKPGTKFKGQKTVADVKLGAGLKKLKDVSEDYKDTIRKFGKTVDKATAIQKRVKWYQKAANKKRYSEDFYKGKK